MDANALEDMTAFLVPFLPALATMGEKAIEEVGKRLGVEAFDKAKAIWSRLHPKLKPAAVEAVRDAIANPSDESSIVALRQQISKILDDDPYLAADLAKLVGSGVPQIHTTATGDQSIAVTGNVSGPLTTGDINVHIDVERPGGSERPKA